MTHLLTFVVGAAIVFGCYTLLRVIIGGICYSLGITSDPGYSRNEPRCCGGKCDDLRTPAPGDDPGTFAARVILADMGRKHSSVYLPEVPVEVPMETPEGAAESLPAGTNDSAPEDTSSPQPEGNDPGRNLPDNTSGDHRHLIARWETDGGKINPGGEGEQCRNT